MTRPLLLLLALLTAARAEDLTTTDGKTYTGVTITKVEQHGLRILHASGTAMVPFAKLSQDLQKKYNYDPAKAEAAAKEAAATLAETQRIAKEKREANDWHHNFQLDPESQDQLTISYTSHEEQTRLRRASAAQDNLTKTQTEKFLKSLPQGGNLWGTMRSPTSDEAAKHKFTILVFDREGNEIATAPNLMNLEVTKGPDGPWQKNVAVSLLSPLKEGDRIRIVDQVDNRHHDFTVKAKTPAPQPPPKP